MRAVGVEWRVNSLYGSVSPAASPTHALCLGFLWLGGHCLSDDCVCSYYIGRVFRGSNASSGGAPKEIHEATFDIVWDSRSRSGDGDGGDSEHTDRRASLEYSGVNVGGVTGVDADGLFRRAASFEAEVLAVAADVMKRFWIDNSSGSQPVLRLNNLRVGWQGPLSWPFTLSLSCAAL